MKRSNLKALSIFAFSGLAFLSCLGLSCAGSAGAAPKEAAAVQPQAAPKAPEKQRKERLVPVQIPVLTKETSFYADGLVDEYYVYKYDAALQKLLEKDSFDPSRPDPVEKLLAESPAAGVAVESSYDADGKLRSRKETSLDAAGRVVQEKVSDSKGLLQSSSTYAYDAAGNRLEWKAFDGKGNLKAVTKYSYEKGKLVLIAMSDGSGAKTGSISVEYDAAGLPARKSYKAADGSLQKYESSAFEKGLPVSVETRRGSDNGLVMKVVYTYGDLGQVLTATTTDAQGAIKDRRSFEYGLRTDQKTEVYYE
jgi:hypothetical protein